MAIRAVGGDIASRYGAAQATLGSMTREWARGGGTSDDAETTKRTTTTTTKRKATTTSSRETLKTISNTMFTSEVARGAREVAAAERAAKANAVDAKTTTTKKARETKVAKTATGKGGKGSAPVAVSEKKTNKGGATKKTDVKEAKVKQQEKTKKDAPRAPSTPKTKAKVNAPRVSVASSETNPAIEIAKFVLPAICGWIARQRSVSALKQKLEEMTLKKVASANEANKLRRDMVELRDELKRAEFAADDAQQSSEAMMARKTAGKEVKMKQMAVDHAEQLRKERAECLEEVRAAKALEIGARWREEACRRMKNRAVEEAAALEKKVAELEKKLKDAQDDKRKDLQDKVKGTVLNAVRSFQSFGRRSGANKAPVIEDAALPATSNDGAEAEVADADAAFKSKSKKNTQSDKK